MRYLGTFLVTCAVVTASNALAQTAVTTTGGSQYDIPVYTGTATIGLTDITLQNGTLKIAYPSSTPSLVSISPDGNLLVNVVTDASGGPTLIKAVNAIAKPTITESAIEGVYGEGDASNSSVSLVVGVEARAVSNAASSGAVVKALYGVIGRAQQRSTGTITNAYGLYSQITGSYDSASKGTMTNAYGTYVDTITTSGGPGTITNAYELYLQSPDSGISKRFALFQNGNAPNYFAGNVGIGTQTPGAQLEVNGSVKLSVGTSNSIIFQDGTTQNTAFTGVLCGGDYAETVDVDGNRKNYESGDVMVIAAEAGSDVAKSSDPYSTLVAGVYSTKPGVIGRRQITDSKASSTEIPMAMIGIVPTKVTAENGSIKRGDLLVTSSTAGYAMKGTNHERMLGAVIGKALGNLDSGAGVIEVLITLQ